MNADANPPKSSPAGASPPSSVRSIVRGLLLLTALGLAGLYAYSMSNPSQSLTVKIVNNTGTPLEGLTLSTGSETPLGNLAVGATAEATVPLRANLELEFGGPDDVRRKARYPYEHTRGVGHKMTITLVKGNADSAEGRQVESKFSVLFGGEVAYIDLIDDMEMIFEPINAENSSGSPARRLPPPTTTLPEMSTETTAPEPVTTAEPAPRAKPEKEPEAPKAP